MKPKRNETCPCGSGRKYKKCCFKKDPQTETRPRFFYTDLDELSNQVPSLISERKYDEAELVCQRLFEQFPEQIDGLLRLAELWEAKGDKQKASEYYQKTAEFADQANGFEKSSVMFYMRKAKQLNEDGEG